jgi:hypothetical protein
VKVKKERWQVTVEIKGRKKEYSEKGSQKVLRGSEVKRSKLSDRKQIKQERKYPRHETEINLAATYASLCSLAVDVDGLRS